MALRNVTVEEALKPQLNFVLCCKKLPMRPVIWAICGRSGSLEHAAVVPKVSRVKRPGFTPPMLVRIWGGALALRKQ